MNGMFIAMPVQKVGLTLIEQLFIDGFCNYNAFHVVRFSSEVISCKLWISCLIIHLYLDAVLRESGNSRMEKYETYFKKKLWLDFKLIHPLSKATKIIEH